MRKRRTYNDLSLYILLCVVLPFCACHTKRMSNTRWDLVRYTDFDNKEHIATPTERLGITPFLRFRKINRLTGRGECEWNTGCNYYRAPVKVYTFSKRIKINTKKVERTFLDCYDSSDWGKTQNAISILAPMLRDSIGRTALYQAKSYEHTCDPKKKYLNCDNHLVFFFKKDRKSTKVPVLWFRKG